MTEVCPLRRSLGPLRSSARNGTLRRTLRLGDVIVAQARSVSLVGGELSISQPAIHSVNSMSASNFFSQYDADDEDEYRYFRFDKDKQQWREIDPPEVKPEKMENVDEDSIKLNPYELQEGIRNEILRRKRKKIQLLTAEYEATRHKAICLAAEIAHLRRDSWDIEIELREVDEDETLAYMMTLF